MTATKILVVAIGSPAQAIFIPALQEAGYKPSAAGSAAQALKELASQKYDLLLIDSSGPVLDAVNLCEKCKQKYPDLPVIIMTTDHELGPALAAIRVGAFDYLPKPVERMQLLSVINRASEHRRMGLETTAYLGNLESLAAARTEQLRKVITDHANGIAADLLAEMVEARQIEPRGHADYVTAFAIVIARVMGLSGENIRVIARGAFLHNVGMAFMPDIILQQRLWPMHALHGWQVLRKTGYSEEAELVFTHEEHFDGSGHPRALKGEQIPLGARIIALAHFVAELMAKTEHGSRPPFEDIRAKVKLQSGKRFDPQVADAFLSAPETVWTDLRDQLDLKHPY